MFTIIADTFKYKICPWTLTIDNISTVLNFHMMAINLCPLLKGANENILFIRFWNYVSFRSSSVMFACDTNVFNHFTVSPKSGTNGFGMPFSKQCSSVESVKYVCIYVINVSFKSILLLMEEKYFYLYGSQFDNNMWLIFSGFVFAGTHSSINIQSYHYYIYCWYQNRVAHFHQYQWFSMRPCLIMCNN